MTNYRLGVKNGVVYSATINSPRSFVFFSENWYENNCIIQRLDVELECGPKVVEMCEQLCKSFAYNNDLKYVDYEPVEFFD